MPRDKKGKMFDGKVYWRYGRYYTEQEAINESNKVVNEKNYIFGGPGPFLTKITHDNDIYTVWIRGVNWANFNR